MGAEIISLGLQEVGRQFLGSVKSIITLLMIIHVMGRLYLYPS